MQNKSGCEDKLAYMLNLATSYTVSSSGGWSGSGVARDHLGGGEHLLRHLSHHLPYGGGVGLVAGLKLVSHEDAERIELGLGLLKRRSGCGGTTACRGSTGSRHPGKGGNSGGQSLGTCVYSATREQ